MTAFVLVTRPVKHLFQTLNASPHEREHRVLLLKRDVHGPDGVEDDVGEPEMRLDEWVRKEPRCGVAGAWFGERVQFSSKMKEDGVLLQEVLDLVDLCQRAAHDGSVERPSDLRRLGNFLERYAGERVFEPLLVRHRLPLRRKPFGDEKDRVDEWDLSEVCDDKIQPVSHAQHVIERRRFKDPLRTKQYAQTRNYPTARSNILVPQSVATERSLWKGRLSN